MIVVELELRAENVGGRPQVPAWMYTAPARTRVRLIHVVPYIYVAR